MTRGLLLLDNAESPGELRDWPPAGPGHILITSRNPGWGELAARVEVDVLPRPDSVELIYVSRPGVSTAEADRLVEALGDLPRSPWYASARFSPPNPSRPTS